jgi:hypothetical protein
MQSPFDNPIVPTPSPEGNHEGTRGGHDMKEGPAGLTDSPFSEAWIKSVGQKETAGTLPNQPTTTTIKDEVAPGMASIEDFQADRTWNN